MNYDEPTDADLYRLRRERKRVEKPNARWTRRQGNERKDYLMTGDSGARYKIYLRRSLYDALQYTAGIAVVKPDGTLLTLARYNGSHFHGSARLTPHVHLTTAQAIRDGLKPERGASPTDRYEDVEGALRCLVHDFRVAGLPGIDPDERLLFDETEDENDADD